MTLLSGLAGQYAACCCMFQAHSLKAFYLTTDKEICPHCNNLLQILLTSPQGNDEGQIEAGMSKVGWKRTWPWILQELHPLHDNENISVTNNSYNDMQAQLTGSPFSPGLPGAPATPLSPGSPGRPSLPSSPCGPEFPGIPLKPGRPKIVTSKKKEIN